MRRLIIWLCVATCTFALGFAIATLRLQLRQPVVTEIAPVSIDMSIDTVALNPGADISASSKLAILNYCELVNHPERYSGKVVRVRATLTGFIHGMLFYDENCAGPDAETDTRTAVTYDPLHAAEITETLNRARGSDHPLNWFEPVRVIAVGKFEKVTPTYESDTIYDTAALQFEVIHVEKATKLR